jgi:cysteine desulfurase
MRAYLDHNATTPVDPRVLDAMLPYFSGEFGNASSIHAAGQRARAAVDAARESVARLIGAKPAEIVFTSGGTEADNLAIFGAVEASTHPHRHVITTAIEHHAVLNSCEALAKHGDEVTFVRVGPSGVVDPEDVRRAVRPDTAVISVMHVNNELGTIQLVEEIGRIAEEAGVAFHCDAVQAAGKLALDVDRMGVDLLSLSAHKIGGPKGVGALYVRSSTKIKPRAFGGQHERGLRAGTENVAGIVGLGKAAELARTEMAGDTARISALRDKLEERLLEAIPAIRINGDHARRAGGTTNITFAGAGGEALLIALDLQGVACSTGAACSSGAVEPSHVLLAIGLSHDEARSSLRFSLGRTTTAEEVDYAMGVIPGVVERMRALSPMSVAAR